MVDDVEALDSVDLDRDVDMQRDSDNEEEDDEEEDDEDEHYGKEPRTIGQGEMENTSADHVDIMVDDQPIVLPEEGQKMHEHTPRPQHLVPAPRPQTPESCLQPRSPETHPLSGLEHLRLETPQKPHPAVPTLGESEASGNTSDMDVDQPLRIESAGDDSLPDVPLSDVPLPDVPFPDVPLPDVPLPDVPLPDVPLHDVPLPEVCPDSSLGEF